MEKPKPIFEKRIFWDVNFEKIDYDAKANFVLSVFLSGAMWKISASAADIMAMKR
jgi:hypothetical protein